MKNTLFLNVRRFGVLLVIFLGLAGQALGQGRSAVAGELRAENGRAGRDPVLLDLSRTPPWVNPEALNGERLQIITPAGRVLLGRGDRVDQNAKKSGSWVGRIEGASSSRVVFGRSGNRLAGVVDLSADQPEDRWEIRPLGGGGYDVV